jgi:hypothetical protein
MKRSRNPIRQLENEPFHRISELNKDYMFVVCIEKLESQNNLYFGYFAAIKLIAYFSLRRFGSLKNLDKV